MVNDSQARDTVADNVKALRADRGWTLEQLSERLEAIGYPISLQVLWKTEQKKRKVSVDDLVGLARAFGVTVDRMLASSLVPDDLVPLVQSMADVREQRRDLELHAHMSRSQADAAVERLAKFDAATADQWQRISKVIKKLDISRDELIQHIEDRWGQETADLFRDL